MPKLIASLASYKLKSNKSHCRNVILHRTNKLLELNLHIFEDLLRYIVPGHRISDHVTLPLKRRAYAILLLLLIRN